MADTSVTDRVAGALRRALPWLAPRELASLARCAEVRWAEAGRVLVEEGRPATSSYVLLEGSATVTHEGRRLATLGAGAVIGSTTQQSGRPSIATVTATSRVCLVVIDLGRCRTGRRRDAVTPG